MQIDWPVIREQAIRRGVTMTRVSVRDFDHNDQVPQLAFNLVLLPGICAAVLCIHSCASTRCFVVCSFLLLEAYVSLFPEHIKSQYGHDHTGIRCNGRTGFYSITYFLQAILRGA